MSGRRVESSDNVHMRRIFGPGNSGYVLRGELSDVLSYTIESIGHNRLIIANLQQLTQTNRYCRCDYFDVVDELGVSKIK